MGKICTNNKINSTSHNFNGIKNYVNITKKKLSDNLSFTIKNYIKIRILTKYQQNINKTQKIIYKKSKPILF